MLYIAIISGSEEDCCIFDSEESRTKAIIDYIQISYHELIGRQNKFIQNSFRNFKKKPNSIKHFLDCWNDYWQEDIENGAVPSFTLCEEDEDEEDEDEDEWSDGEGLEIVEYKEGEYYYV